MIHVCPDCGERFSGPGACPRDGATLAPGDDPLLGQQISSYRITRLLGAGGMGRVYKAVQPSIGARVAIKVLAVEGGADQGMVERFFAEARAVNLIRHEQIVNVLDLARLPDGRPYIVMEYLDGASLSGVLKQRGTLPLGAMARMAAEVLDALAAAHAHGIVHRDLKPDNIWISLAGRAKVLDFGIAKLDPGLAGGHQATRAGSIMGTPPYMSPEQAMARVVDARADLYSMGIILYECATGKPPFMAEALFDILRMHVEMPPPPPRAARPDLPPEMEQVILRALAKDPAQRFPDAHQMAQALLASAGGLPADAWAELRMASGVALPGIPSGGVITPFGPRVPSAPPTSPRTHSAAPMAYDPTVAQPKRSRMPLVLGALIALALAGGGVAAGVMLSRRSEPPTPPPVVATPVAGQPAQPESQARVATALGGVPAPATQPSQPPSPEAPATQPSVPQTPETPPPQPPPSENEPAALGDAKHFDAIAYLPEAQRLARLKLENAELTQMIVQNVGPEGTADLTLGGYPFVKYAFRSTTASQLGDRPQGSQLDCMVNVFVTSYQGVRVEPRSDAECSDRIIGWPRCSPADIWKKAIEEGVPENAIATLQWMTDFNDKTHWLLLIGTKTTKWIDDDCSQP